MTCPSAQRTANDRLWKRTDRVKPYSGTELRPVETILFVRYREALSARVLELGCGAGRMTGHLAVIAKQVTAVDVSSHMLQAVSERYPEVHTEQGDLRDLKSFDDGSFDAIVAGFNVPDVLDDEERGEMLDEVFRILTHTGILIMSSHNRGAQARISESLKPRITRPRALAALLLRGRKWHRNRRQLLAYERHERDYSILNDSSHDFEALHYYIDRDGQARQLAEHGYELLECLDLEGRSIEPGDSAPAATELHYVARKPEAAPSSSA